MIALQSKSPASLRGRALLAVLSLLLLGTSGGAAAAGPAVDVLMLGQGSSRGFEPWWPKFQAACAKDGVNIQILAEDSKSGLSYGLYTSDLLRKFHVVLVSGMPEANANTAAAAAEVAGFQERLDAFYRAGGGVLWAPVAFNHWGTLWNQPVGRRYDVQSLEEDLVDPAKVVDINPVFNHPLYRYLWTTNVTPHAVTDGVRGLLLPTLGEWSWPGTVPMKFGPSWTVLVRGMDSTSTVGNAAPAGSGRHEFKPEIKGTYSAAPELVGVRESVTGAGRMMVFPFHATHTWRNFNHFAFNDAMMLKGDGTHPSDGLRLFLNGCKWLAAPAAKAGLGGGGYRPPPPPAVDLSPIDWSKVKFPEGAFKAYSSFKPTEFRGLVGARTVASDGQGTVAEYVAEAKKLGLSFIIFLEALETCDDARFSTLVTDCKAQTTAEFAAIPGYLYRDLGDNLHFAFAVTRLPLADNLTPERRVLAPNNIVDQNAWNNGQGIAELGKVKLDLAFLFLFTSIAPYVYDGGKLVDDGLARYVYAEGLGHQYPPLSLTIVRSPQEVAATAAAAHLTVYTGKELSDFLPAVTRQAERPPIYLTNGPRIERWSDMGGSSRIFRPGGERFRLELKASSPAGLREVVILNAKTGQPYRRFRPEGAKEFSCRVDESHKDQWYFVPIVTDGNGRTAVGATVFTYQMGNQFHMMSDRLMGMHHSRVWNTEHTQIKTIGGWIGHPWTKPYLSGGSYPYNPWDEELKIQGIDGGAIHPAALDLDPQVATTAGTEPKVPAFRFRNTLSSFDLAVMDYVGDAQFLVNQRTNQKTKGWWPTPEPTAPNTIADITCRTWAVRPRYHASVSANVHEITVTFKRDTTLDRIRLGGMRSGGEKADPFLMLNDRTGQFAWLVRNGDEFRRQGTLDAGGYLFPANYRGGAVGLINLGPEPIAYDSSGARSQLFVAGNGRAVKAGEQLQIRFLTFMKPWQEQNNNQWLQQFISGFGIGSGKPGYALEVNQGKVREINYALDLGAVDGGATFTIGPYDLPHNLVVRVAGLPADALAGRYDPKTKQLLLLPVLEGRAATSVRTNEHATTLYVGELLHGDNPAVRLSLVQDGPDKLLLELHNPTDQPQACTLTAATGFAPLAGWRDVVEVAPCSSVKREIPTPAGTLAYTAWEGE